MWLEIRMDYVARVEVLHATGNVEGNVKNGPIVTRVACRNNLKGSKKGAKVHVFHDDLDLKG